MSIFLFGCSTTQLWEESNYYHDTIKNFNLENHNLIFIGEKYHYIFVIDNNLQEILLSKDTENPSIKTGTFNVDKNNSVTGYIYVIYNEDKYKYINNLVDDGDDFKDSRDFDYKLKGTRYIPAPDFQFENQLYKEYIVEFHENWSQYDTTSKVLLSPITVSIDTASAIMIGGALAIALPFVAVEHIIPDDIKKEFNKEFGKGFK